MSARNEPAITADSDALTDDSVREYLKNHSDFLQRHPDMLDFLHVNHASGSAVSLVEKQVSVLRERNTEMRQRLNALTANARSNDKLYEQTRHLVLALLEAESVPALCAAYRRAMQADFDVEHTSIILFGDPASAPDGVRVVPAEAAQAAVGALQGKVTQHFAQAFPVAFTGQYPVEDTYRGQARVRRCQWSHPAVRLPGTDPGYRAADRPRPCAACRAVAVLQESVRHRRWPHGCRCRPR